MKRWDCQAENRIEDSRVDAFLAELVEVSRRHGMTLGHEDGHGSFIVYVHVDEFRLKWLLEAAIDRSGQ